MSEELDPALVGYYEYIKAAFPSASMWGINWKLDETDNDDPIHGPFTAKDLSPYAVGMNYQDVQIIIDPVRESWSADSLEYPLPVDWLYDQELLISAIDNILVSEKYV